ncbi:MAG TPA: DUF4013 domain-containing protein [Terracidiphilus sp.]|nr:DUF4013 domain-containing protein [Terracidiphilus sp.]
MPLIASSLWPFGLLISLGWSVEAICRLARGAAQPLPRTRDLARIFKHGFVVTAALFLYFIIPLAILYKLVEFSWITEAWDLVVAVWQALTHTNKTPLIATVVQFLLKLLANSTAPIVYLLVASPLFLVARLRYALTGQVRSFFNLFGNVVACFQSVGEILLYLFLGVVTRLAITFILAVMAPTIVGVSIPVVLAAANTWILAYLAAKVAKKMYEQDGIGAHVIPPGTPLQVPAPLQPAPIAADFPQPAAEPPALPSPQQSAAKPVLYCHRGPLKDKIFPISQSWYYIGRSPKASQIIVGLREVSSRHVRVKVDASSNGVWVEDMDSTNGTYYRSGSEPWRRLNGRVCLQRGGRFKLSRDAAEFEIRDE